MNDLSKNKYMTVKEVAQALGVSYRSVHRVLEKTGNLDGTVTVENGKTTYLNEEQVILIKEEIQKHHNLQNRTIDNVTIPMEMKRKSIEIIKEQEVLGKNFKIYGTIEEPLFLAKDVAEWIDYDLDNINKMLLSVDEDEKVTGIIFRVSQGRERWFLTEDGLYEVLMQSRKPIAKEFKKQVKIILKDVRRHGLYAKDELLDNPDLLIEIITKLKEERERNKELKRDNEEYKTQLEYSKEWYSIKRVAKKNEVSHKTFNWRKLKSKSEELGFEVKKIFDANYGEVNCYHEEVWMDVYPDYEL